MADKPAETTAPVEPMAPSTTPTTRPTQAPTTAPTTAPTEAPTTAPTTQPTVPTTAPTEPILSPELWLTDPEYPSFEEYLASDPKYVETKTDCWLIGDGISFVQYSVSDLSYSVMGGNHGEVYVIPNAESLKDYRIWYADGKYAYLYNDAELVKLELVTGNILDRLQLQLGNILSLKLVDGVMMLSVSHYEESVNLYRIYLPELKAELYYTLDAPERVYSVGSSKHEHATISWQIINPELIDIMVAETNKTDSQYRASETESLWSREDPLNTIPTVSLRPAYRYFQEVTNLPAYLEYTYDFRSNSLSSHPIILCECELGTGQPHDHSNPVTVELGEPTTVNSAWQQLPDMQIQSQMTAAKPERYYLEYSAYGTGSAKLYLTNSGIYTELLEANLHYYPTCVDGENGILCMTQDNSILHVAYDGSICNTLYVSSGNLVDIAYQDDFLYVIEDDKILEIDLENYQYRTIVQQAHLSSLSFDGKGKLRFLASEGLSWEYYTYNVKEAVIEH